MLARSADRFPDTAQALTDDDLGRASALPGWTRGHVLTHVAKAADARTGLLHAARAGQVGVQYPWPPAMHPPTGPATSSPPSWPA